MKLVPYDKNNIEGYKPTSNYELLNEFVNSGFECAKIENWNHKSVYSAQSSFQSSIKRFHMNNVKVIVRGDNLYLVKTT